MTWCIKDNFVGSNGTLLSAHTPDRGTSWTLHPSTSGQSLKLNGSGGVILNSAGSATYYAGETPPSADYAVSFTLGATSTSNAAIWGRLDTSVKTGYYVETSGGSFRLYKFVNGTGTLLGSYAATATINDRVELRMSGTSIVVLVNYVSRISVTDSAVTAAGVPGIYSSGSMPIKRYMAHALAPANGTRTYLVAGQSNASGRGTNNQEWTSSTHVAWLYGNDDRWRMLLDPFDDSRGEIGTVASDTATGSWIPSMATDLMAGFSADVAFVPSATGGVGISSWAAGANHSDRATLYGNANARAQAAAATTGGITKILWWQGETDAINQVSAATYQAALETLASNFNTDLSANMVACILQDSTGITDAYESAIRTGTQAAIDASAYIEQGPTFSDQTSDDSYHFTTDSKLLLAGQRWATTVLDTTPPSVPADLVVKCGDTIARIEWSASTGSPAGYEYRLDSGTAVDVGNVLYAWLSGLTNGTSQTVEIRSYDSPGNRSAWSSAVTFTPVAGNVFIID